MISSDNSFTDDSLSYVSYIVVTRTPDSQLPVPPGTPSFLNLSGRKKEDEILLDSCSPSKNLV
jgi:hypothetical protein